MAAYRSFFRVLAMTALLFAVAIHPDRIMAADANTSPIGVWLSVGDSGGKGHIQIYRCGAKLCGKLIHSNTPEARDVKNPDEALRSRKLIGSDLLWGFEPDGENLWTGGRIYDPTSGKTWKCQFSVGNAGNKLNVRGYWGIALFGQTRTWTRVR